MSRAPDDLKPASTLRETAERLLFDCADNSEGAMQTCECPPCESPHHRGSRFNEEIWLDRIESALREAQAQALEEAAKIVEDYECGCGEFVVENIRARAYELRGKP